MTYKSRQLYIKLKTYNIEVYLVGDLLKIPIKGEKEIIGKDHDESEAADLHLTETSKLTCLQRRR